jgi:DNA repair protein RecO (recombination protein O)
LSPRQTHNFKVVTLNSNSTEAILLRRSVYSETSLIVSWLTADFGLLRTMAKGARGKKCALAGRLDLFYLANISFARSRRSELHQLREVTLANTFPGLRERYARLEVAAYFVELLEIVAEADHPVPELFDLMKRALGYLNENQPERRAVLHFERELVRCEGTLNEQWAKGAGAGKAKREPSPAEAIFNVYHRLPAGREKLLGKLS